MQWMGKKTSRKNSKEMLFNDSVSELGDPVKDVFQENSKLKGKLSSTQQQLNIRDRQITEMQTKIKKLHESTHKDPKKGFMDKSKRKHYTSEAGTDSEIIGNFYDKILIEQESECSPAVLRKQPSINVDKVFGQMKKSNSPPKGFNSIKKENADIAKLLQK